MTEVERIAINALRDIVALDYRGPEPHALALARAALKQIAVEQEKARG